MQPESELVDCEFCKNYEHYSWRNPDSEKRGKTIYELGDPVKRREPLKNNCAECPSERIWTPANREIYKKWRLAIDGFNVGILDKKILHHFYLLSEAAGDIRRFHLENALVIGLNRIRHG